MDDAQTLMKLIAALAARLEITDSVLASVIATHPNPVAILDQWNPTIAKAATMQILADVASPELANEIRQQAMASQIELWRDVLNGIVQNGPGSPEM